MKILMFDRVPEAINWAKERINITGNVNSDLTTVALVDDNNQFQAVTVYSAYTSQNIDMHIAAIKGRNWLSRNYFNASFYLPFKILQVPRVTGLIKAGNERSAHFVERLGFQFEGRMRKAFDDGKDLLLYGFLLEEYQQHPWSKYEIDSNLVSFGSVPEGGGRGDSSSSSEQAGGAETVA